MTTTHEVEFQDALVVKRFRSRDRDEPAREWRALTLLAAHAPGLAPRPVRRDADTVVMTRLPGRPLRGGNVDDAQCTALAEAVTALYEALPPAVLSDVPTADWDPAEALSRARSASAAPPPPGTDPLIAEAYRAGGRWAEGARLEGHTPVFGTADGNLANCLWDGERVRLVDFEASGRSDRALELAELVEHISTWVDTDFDASRFLGRFDLSPAEAVRLRELRRACALIWLAWLLPGGPATARNPVGSGERQAVRVLELL